jgi:poly-gamma-glutamate synthesis protein (capsule biosynthesis protein)
MRSRAAALVLVGTLAGCTEQADPAPVPDTGPAPSAPTSPAAAPTTGVDAEAEAVMVVNRARRVREVSASRAERIRSGQARGWRPVATVARVAREPRAVAFVPLREVRPWVRAVTVAGVDPLAGTTTVRVVGDIMLDRGVAAASPPDDPVWTLRTVRGLLAGADLTVGNLESALSENGEPQQPGDDSFAASPAVLDGLAGLGVDALSLANNHTGDYGETALLETLAAVRRSPVVGFGAGRDLAEASRPVVLEADGLRVGLVGFNAIGETASATADSPGALSVRMPPRTGPLNGADLRHLLRVVRRLDRRADVVVVVPHWGGNYTHVADPAQTRVARRLAAAGADLVAGGHPHWVQGIERVGSAVVAHSLGNLVFDMDFMEQTMEGVALTARFAGDRLVAVELTAYRLDGSFRPRVVSGPEAAGVLEDVRAHSRGAFSAGS